MGHARVNIEACQELSRVNNLQDSDACNFPGQEGMLPD